MRLVILMVWWLTSQLAWAHHSYSDFDRDERFVLTGTIKEIHWANPHIIFIVDDGEQDVDVEWVTITGAERTGVDRSQFEVGDEFVVVGSRHRDPDKLVMTVLKEMRLPKKGWEWISPTARYYNNDNNVSEVP